MAQQDTPVSQPRDEQGRFTPAAPANEKTSSSDAQNGGKAPRDVLNAHAWEIGNEPDYKPLY
jgi:hypothetical protein